MYEFHFWVVVLWLLVFQQVSNAEENVEHHCVWYGQCGINPNNALEQNCAVNHPAKPLKSGAITKKQALKILKKRCKFWFQDPDNGKYSLLIV